MPPFLRKTAKGWVEKGLEYQKGHQKDGDFEKAIDFYIKAININSRVVDIILFPYRITWQSRAYGNCGGREYLIYLL